jgi:hypothetical protein
LLCIGMLMVAWSCLGATAQASIVKIESLPELAADFGSGSSTAVVARGSDNHVYIRMFDNGEWAPWQSLGGEIVGNPSVISEGANNLSVYARGVGNVLFHRWWNGSAWSSWEELNTSTIAGDPKPLLVAPDEQDVFVRGPNRELLALRFESGHWASSYTNLGGVLTSEPEPASLSAHNENVFATGTDGRLYATWTDGQKWEPWAAIGQATLNELPPSAVAWPSPHEHLTLFAVSESGELVSDYWEPSSGWHQWEGRGRHVITPPAALTLGYPNLAVFAGVEGFNLADTWFSGSQWEPWSELPGEHLGGWPTAISPAEGQEAIFARGGEPNGSLIHVYFANGQWSGWENLGNPTTTPVDGISDQNMQSWPSEFDSLFSEKWIGNPTSRIRYARYVVQWNAATGTGKYEKESLERFEKWYESAQALKLTIVVTVADYQGASSGKEPSSAKVQEADEALVKDFPSIAYLGAWNEPNLEAEKFHVKAAGAGHYWNSANAACAAVGNRCAAIAGELHDEAESSKWTTYLSELKGALSGTPAVWGVHPYEYVTFGTSAYKGALEKFRSTAGSSQVWATEVGAYCRSNEDQEASRIVGLPSTLGASNIFYYEFREPSAGEGCGGSSENTSLYANNDSERPDASIIYGG